MAQSALRIRLESKPLKRTVCHLGAIQGWIQDFDIREVNVHTNWVAVAPCPSTPGSILRSIVGFSS